MGLELKNPIIVASSGLTKSAEKIKSCADAGAGAVVIKSLFEEVLAGDDWNLGKNAESHPEVSDYLRSEIRYQYGLDDYCNLINSAKQQVDIPVLASINCTSDKWLTKFAERVQKSGADGLELNVYLPRVSNSISSKELEEKYYSILVKTKEVVDIPVAMKIGSYFTSLPQVVQNLHYRKLDGLVMFNRFTEPDININKLELGTTFSFSSKEDVNRLLRWVALIAAKSPVNISATTGIHTWEGIVKLLLAGATTVQLASVLYKNGLGVIKAFLDSIENWMSQHNFESVNDFRGSLNFYKAPNPEQYLRAQFMEKIRDVE